MVNTVIVDERDTAIQYSTGWNNAGAFLEFDGTTRWSSIEGSTATFTFVGSSVTVYGSVAGNPAQAGLSFMVDKSLIGSYSAKQGGTALYHEALYVSPTLSEGSHTLVITQNAAQSGGVIYLDYIMYDTESTTGTYFIDDRDPRITYTPAWRQFGSENDFQHTSLASSNPGDSFSFQFEGSAILYYGGLTTGDAGFSVSSIVLDGGTPFIYTVPSPIPATTNNKIYHAEGLSTGKHTLVVTATNGHSAWMDYFLITPNPSSGGSTAPPPPAPPPPGTTTTVVKNGAGTVSTVTVIGGSASPPPSSSSTSSGSVPTSHTSAASLPSGIAPSLSPSGTGSAAADVLPSGSSSNTGSSSNNTIPVSSTKKTHTGAIAGGVISAVLVLALLIAAFLFLHRRRARQGTLLEKSDPLSARSFVPSASSDESTTAPPSPMATSPYSPSGSYATSSAALLEPLRGNRSNTGSTNTKLAREAAAAADHPDPAPRTSGASSWIAGAPSTMAPSFYPGSEAPPQYRPRSEA
ncbi:hypothetical protein B0H14DRAFT_2696352 [Mycena olivaceomarginata]|nr:hypothetical protein B0H14DRAFT_2696352 [Mycena olivaceomarginata]